MRYLPSDSLFRFGAERPEHKAKGGPALVVIACLWVLAVCTGLRILLNYDYSPGSGAIPPGKWPRDAKIKPVPGQPTLIVLAHPRCPCTRATLGELALIMARCQGKLNAHVLFCKPPELQDDWEKTDLWQSAVAIPGVSVMVDEDGAEANRFHAATSGQVILYDEKGRLSFSGGITESRGHYGDNQGRDAIVSLVNHGTAKQTRTSVFGCSLLGEKPRGNSETGGR
jgi:hypothetical protein